MNRPEQAATEPGPSVSVGGLALSLEVAATVGYGVWLLLGLALALGVYSDGRGEVLVPLLLGGVLLSLGLPLACLPGRIAPAWHGWRPGRGVWPGREAMLALACYWPMLALAGLARGENDFWATRVSGALLMLGSLVALIYGGPRADRARGGEPRLAAQLPLSRVVSALYGGGLWLWLCVAGQGPEDRIGDLHPWILGLLLIALVLGLVEGARWQLLEPIEPTLSERPVRRYSPLDPRRLLAAALSYAVPCICLLCAELVRDAVPLAACAGVSHLLGRWLEQQLYVRAICRQRREARRFG
jgi:hypothetical protein